MWSGEVLWDRVDSAAHPLVPPDNSYGSVVLGPVAKRYGGVETFETALSVLPAIGWRRHLLP